MLSRFRKSALERYLSMLARDMILPSFDSSHWDDSNELNIVLIQSVDPEIYHRSEFLFFDVRKFKKCENWDNSLCSDHKNIIKGSLDSSH